MSDSFYIKYIKANETPEPASAPKAKIEEYPWGGDYRPECDAAVIYREGDGFYVRMRARESDPRTTYKNYNDPVCNDSCLEFFCNYVPDSEKTYYINIEMNSAGTFLSYLAEGMGVYKDISKLTDTMPTVTPSRDGEYWQVDLHIPAKTVADVYGLDGYSLKPGDFVKCNFYKCGSECEIPHYGAWRPIDTPSPNFHQPSFFGKAEVK